MEVSASKRIKTDDQHLNSFTNPQNKYFTTIAGKTYESTGEEMLLAFIMKQDFKMIKLFHLNAATIPPFRNSLWTWK